MKPSPFIEIRSSELVAHIRADRIEAIADVRGATQVRTFTGSLFRTDESSESVRARADKAMADREVL